MDARRRTSIRVRAGRLERDEYRVEGDYSSASYWFAAAAATRRHDARARPRRSRPRRATRASSTSSRRWAARSTSRADEITVTGPETLRGGTFDCNATPDIVPTLAAIAPLASSPVEIVNVANLRVKESDRLATVTSELRRLGATVEERPDALLIQPGWSDEPASIETHNDHRIAMAFAIAGLARGNVTIAQGAGGLEVVPAVLADAGRSAVGRPSSPPTSEPRRDAHPPIRWTPGICSSPSCSSSRTASSSPPSSRSSRCARRSSPSSPSRAARARRWRSKLIRHLDAYLSATQLGITLASLALGWIGEPAFHHLIQPLFTRLRRSARRRRRRSPRRSPSSIISVLHIVLGELAPKSIAIQKPVGTSLWIAHLLHAFYVVTYPGDLAAQRHRRARCCGSSASSRPASSEIGALAGGAAADPRELGEGGHPLRGEPRDHRGRLPVLEAHRAADHGAAHRRGRPLDDASRSRRTWRPSAPRATPAIRCARGRSTTPSA